MHSHWRAHEVNRGSWVTLCERGWMCYDVSYHEQCFLYARQTRKGWRRTLIMSNSPLPHTAALYGVRESVRESVSVWVKRANVASWYWCHVFIVVLRHIRREAELMCCERTPPCLWGKNSSGLFTGGEGIKVGCVSAHSASSSRYYLKQIQIDILEVSKTVR